MSAAGCARPISFLNEDTVLLFREFLILAGGLAMSHASLTQTLVVSTLTQERMMRVVRIDDMNPWVKSRTRRPNAFI